MRVFKSSRRLSWCVTLLLVAIPGIAAGQIPAHLTSPVPGSTLGWSGETFEWSAGIGVSGVVLYVGTAGPGTYDIYFASQGTKLSAAVPNLPVDGRTLYVRLWSHLGGGWQYEDYLYKAATGSAQLMTPAPGSTLTSSTVTFGWIESGEVSQVAMYVGTEGPGSYDLYGAYQGTSLSATVTGVPVNAGKVYVRLWSYLRGQWQYNDYVYQTAPIPEDGVRLTSPAPGSTFRSTAVTFTWTTGGGASLTALYIGTGGVGSYDLYSAYHDSIPPAFVGGLPADGRTIYVRLWFFIGGSWKYNDYIYKAAMGAAQLTTPAPWSTLTGSTVTFGWSVGEGVSEVALYVGIGGVGSYDIYSAILDPSGSATVSGLPTNGETVFVRLWSHTADGWQYGDYTYTASR